jgi:hypothetical protein
MQSALALECEPLKAPVNGPLPQTPPPVATPRVLTPAVRACYVTPTSLCPSPSGSPSWAKATALQGSEGARLKAAGTGVLRCDDFACYLVGSFEDLRLFAPAQTPQGFLEVVAHCLRLGSLAPAEL